MYSISKIIIAAVFSAIGLLACSSEKQPNTETDHHLYQDYLYQYSIIDALLAGVYDGDLTVGELKEKGTLGLGGFNAMDGEMYMNKGAVYKIRYDGSVHRMSDEAKLPIAFVKTFRADTALMMNQKPTSYEQLKDRLRGVLNGNEMYAIRISGGFDSLKARAPAPAHKPYPPLTEHLEDHQHEFELTSTRGIAVGFYLPPYVDRMNVPGFHFHYLAADKKSGGHVLDFTSNSLQVEIDKASGVIVENIDSEAFRRADLQKDRDEELEEVE